MTTTFIYTGDTAASAMRACPNADFHWPELLGEHLPRHPANIIEICPSLVGQRFTTMSEYVILWFSREIREGRIRPDDVVIYWTTFNKDNPRRDDTFKVTFDSEGELSGWPDPRGFYNERADLLFGDDDTQARADAQARADRIHGAFTRG